MMKALPNSGFLFVSKPSGITSSQLVQKIKRKLNLQKVGHTGTLDKAAEGLMILPYNKYTCFADKILGKDKVYDVKIKRLTFTSKKAQTLSYDPYSEFSLDSQTSRF